MMRLIAVVATSLIAQSDPSLTAGYFAAAITDSLRFTESARGSIDEITWPTELAELVEVMGGLGDSLYVSVRDRGVWATFLTHEEDPQWYEAVADRALESTGVIAAACLPPLAEVEMYCGPPRGELTPPHPTENWSPPGRGPCQEKHVVLDIVVDAEGRVLEPIAIGLDAKCERWVLAWASELRLVPARRENGNVPVALQMVINLE